MRLEESRRVELEQNGDRKGKEGPASDESAVVVGFLRAKGLQEAKPRNC